GYAIAVDSSGNAYITGSAGSVDFPTMNALQATSAFKGVRDLNDYGHYSGNAFVSKLNAAGSALVYSTYLGGSGQSYGDTGYSIAVDASGNAYVTGDTDSTDFPTVNAFQGKLNS